MTKYRHVGGFQLMRTSRHWILTVNDEPIRFERKRLAIIGGAAAKQRGLKVKLTEKTEIRFRSGCGIHRSRQSYEIDITNQIP